MAKSLLPLRSGTTDVQNAELKVALENRAFEIQLFWQRSNYFLVLMTAMGVATYSVKNTDFTIITSVFGVICSYFWYKTNLGSKFWQESWEVEVSLLAKRHKIKSFERSIEDVTAQVRDSLGVDRYDSNKSSFRKWIDRKTLEKPSVTYNMIALSLWATVIWGVLTASFAAILIDKYLDFSCVCEFRESQNLPKNTPAAKGNIQKLPNKSAPAA